MKKLAGALGAAVLAAGLAVAAQAADKPRIVVVTHGPNASAFWSVAKNGVTQAATDLAGVATVEYRNPDTFDMVAMKQIIDATVASKPDGLVVSVPDADALGPSIKAAVAAGIPVITMNSGSDVSKKLGALIHVGQSEFEAGVGAGEMMKSLGVQHPVCVNHEVGNVALDLRCDGFSKGIGVKAGIIPVTPDPTEERNTVGAYLTSHPEVDGILVLGQDAAMPTWAAVDQADRVGKTKVATFDISTPVLESIRDGKMVFAIDQQQYMQGYLPVVLLLNYIRYGVMPGANVLTGPGFVTKDNAAKVIAWAKAGYR
jgi:simple sugar transport system substrate-binding protein